MDRAHRPLFQPITTFIYSVKIVTQSKKNKISHSATVLGSKRKELDIKLGSPYVFGASLSKKDNFSWMFVDMSENGLKYT